MCRLCPELYSGCYCSCTPLYYWLSRPITQPTSPTGDDEGGPVFIEPADVAGAHADVGGDADMGDHSDDSITDEEDDHDHGAHDYDVEEEAALLEDELHRIQQQLDGQPQEVGLQWPAHVW